MNAEQQQPPELRVADKQAAPPGVPATEDQPVQDADQLRENIQQTREQLGDTVEALTGKTDVKARVIKRIEQHKQQLRDVGQQAQTKLGDPQQVKQLAGTVQQRARSNPPSVVAAAGAAVVAVLFLRRRRRRYS
jgi:MYXO-CTERM domain-containing protein